MNDSVAIRVDNVSKTFKLPHEKNTSIKSAAINFYKRNRTYEVQEVLKDISFEVEKGEFYGIVGRNGSGKSTLLKLLAGIYTPTDGEIEVTGRLTPFIELGVGFNPELTGRENIFLNGALLGFSRKEMEAMYDEIVEFAELKKFMDQKLKNYSSGMQVRLAFSIAIRAESEILILDEVLAVGDEAFQKKCIDVFEEYKSKKRTVILVTHDMSMVRRFCTKALLINYGDQVMIDEPRIVADEYTKLNSMAIEKTLIKGNNDLRTQSSINLDIKAAKDGRETVFKTGDKLQIKLTWPESTKGVKNAGIAIYKNSGEYVYGANTFSETKKLKGNEAEYSVKLSLGPGNFHIVAGLFGETQDELIDYIQRGPGFIVKSKKNDSAEGLVRLESSWDYND